MMRFPYLKKDLFCIFLFGIISVVSAQTDFIFGRYPAPSPDGQTVIFSYQGDLWRVSVNGGLATRLTVHEAYEGYPLWSPDGKMIAFSSDRNGNDDIFIMPANGGQARQLTFFSNNDRVCDWTKDSRSIVFASRRNSEYHRMPVLYQVPIEGGTPFELVRMHTYEGKISPDSGNLLFTRGQWGWKRKHYRGGSNSNIGCYSFQTDSCRMLTDYNGHDLFPFWSPDGATIYYVTDTDGTYNLWSMDTTGQNRIQLTHHQDDGVRFPAISADGSFIVYEQGFDLWRLSLADLSVNKIEIKAPTDEKSNRIEWKVYSKEATEMAVSPDETQIAFVVHGEIFVMKNKEKTGTAARITHSAARESDLFWAPKGDSLVFVSDQNGNRDIFMAVSTDTAENLVKTLFLNTLQLTDTPDDEFSPKFSPDGKKLAFLRKRGDLYILDVDTKNEKCLFKSWSEPEFSWSPDSKWIAYSRDDKEFNNDVFIIPAEGGEAINVSRHPDEDLLPVWSKDGRTLSFLSRRTGDNMDVWFIYLRQLDEEKTEEELEEEQESKDKTEKKPVNVEIDFQDIYKRLRRVTTGNSAESSLSVSPCGNIIAFVGKVKNKSDLWTIKRDGTELKQFTQNGANPSHVQWSSDGKTITYLSKGGIYTISYEDKEGKTRPIKAKMDVDLYAERAQKFNEAWRTLNDHFYDPDFHGVNWSAMADKYRPAAVHQSMIRDFNDVVSLMLGELNASHLGIFQPPNKTAVQTGMLGLRYDSFYDGDGLCVKQVLADGPCDKETARIHTGDILLKIDGIPLSGNTNVNELLVHKVDTRVVLTVKPYNARREKTVIVRPIDYAAYTNLEYERWIQGKRRLVEKWSEGRIGYVHLRGMNMPSTERFEMELYAVAHGKDGLIIDVRNNGGGWTTDYMLAMLSVKPHAYTIPRGGERGYPQSRLPLYMWSKPVVGMCNEWSFSNAEIFSHALKTLKRGKVVGSPTGGMVISTGGIILIDGSRFRVPFRGWYTMNTGLNQENNGCIPDIIVKEQPTDAFRGIDRQLKKAVEVLLSDLSE